MFILKCMGKSLPDLCAPKAKLPTKLLVPSKGISYFRKYGTDEKVSAIDSKIVQLQRSGTVFQPIRISSSATLHRSSRIRKQCTNMVEEYDTWSQVFNQATKTPSSDSQKANSIRKC